MKFSTRSHLCSTTTDAGGPHLLPEADVENFIRDARQLHEDEQLRSGVRSGHQRTDPAIREEDLVHLKTKFPFLAGFSEHFLKTQPLDRLVKLESAQRKMRELDQSKDSEDRLTANKTNMEDTFVEVKAGRDNRCSILHDARFLCGPSTSAGRIWLAARRSIGLQGFPPVNNYDMEAVGMAGVVTAKGWIEIHNPSSSRISIKQFNINNVGQKLSGSSQDSQDADIMDLGELKLALRAMRTAMSLVMPWNLSIAALEGFLIQTNFCSADLASVERKAQVLTQFCDYVLSRNSERWRNEQQFLTSGELKEVWFTFFSARPQASIQQRFRSQPPQKKQRLLGQPPSDRPAHHSDPSFMALNICFLYNEGKCSKPSGSCTTKYGRPLKHVCNHLEDVSKPSDVCGKDHPRVKNHK